MRWTSLVVLVLGVSACNGKDGSNPSDSDSDSDGPTGNPSGYELLSEADAVGAEVDLPQSVVDAQKVIGTVLAATSLVVVEPQVREDLGAAPANAEFCWTVGAPLTSYIINYLDCATNLGISGSVEVSESAQGPIAFDMKGLSINERPIGGTIGVLATDEPLTFLTYDTAASSPLPTTRSPIGVTIDGVVTGVTWDGGLQIDESGNQVLLWGVGQVTGSGSPTVVRIGGTDEVALVGPIPPAGAVTSGLSYTECRCPMSGDSAYDVDVTIVEVSVDLDALLVGDDGFDDPIIDLTVDLTIPAEAVLTTTGCGDHALTLTADNPDVTVSVDGQVVANEIQNKCDALVIKDEAKCATLVTVASSTEAFTLHIDAASLETAASNDIVARFDGAWCRF